MDIIKLMELNLDTNDLTIRTCLALRRAGLRTILSTLLFGEDNLKQVNNIGTKSLKDLESFLICNGINIHDKEACDELIKEYVEKKLELAPNIITLLDKPLSVFFNIEDYQYYFKLLIDAGYNTIYDILTEKREIITNILKSDSCTQENEYTHKQQFSIYGHVVEVLMEYGINFMNKEACDELIKKYGYAKHSASELEEIIGENTLLENEIDKRQAILQQIKEQLQRRQELETQKEECDNEFNRLVGLYNELLAKESNKTNAK